METFKSIGVHATTVLKNAYTVPPNTSAMILFMQATNVDGINPADITVQWFDASAVDTFKIANLITIPAKAATGLMDTSKLILEPGDILQVLASADGDIDLTVSLMEIS